MTPKKSIKSTEIFEDMQKFQRYPFRALFYIKKMFHAHNPPKKAYITDHSVRENILKKDGIHRFGCRVIPQRSVSPKRWYNIIDATPNGIICLEADLTSQAADVKFQWTGGQIIINRPPWSQQADLAVACCG